MEFSRNFRSIIIKAKNSAIDNGDILQPEHLIAAILETKESTAYKLIDKHIDIEYLFDKYYYLMNKKINDLGDENSLQIKMTKHTEDIMNDSDRHSKMLGKKVVLTEHLLLSLIKFNKITDIDYNEILNEVKNSIKHNETNMDETELMVEKFSTDLTELAKNNQLDPVVGREKELHRIAQILSRRKKNNPILVGHPGCVDGDTLITIKKIDDTDKNHTIIDV